MRHEPEERHLVRVSVLIAAKNDAENLRRSLPALREWADEVLIVDSCSGDGTAEVAAANGASVVQFEYQGGWPKKRQWALDTYSFRNPWILLLDADEILGDALKAEISKAIEDPAYAGYWMPFRIVFLRKALRFGGTELRKLVLFRKGVGKYERRLDRQDESMGDIEIHEHVMVDGSTATLRNACRHENINSLDRYIAKHNEYSNWEAEVALSGTGELQPSLLGSQAQRRRWLKRTFLAVPGSPVLFFLLKYVVQLGFLDGVPGLIYCGLQAVQLFHTKAKIAEKRAAGRRRS